MRSLFRIVILFLVIVVIGTYFVNEYEENRDLSTTSLQGEKLAPNKFENDYVQDEEADIKIDLPEEGLATLIGENVDLLKQYLGSPNRIDASFYGYDWWIYNEEMDNYVQVGVEDDRVVTVYTLSPESNIAPFQIGETLGDIYSKIAIEPEIAIKYEGGLYQFELSDEDINTRPLVKFENFAAQLYIDKFTGTLSSVRFLDIPTLLKQQAYELTYRGILYKPENLSKKEMKAVEESNEQQIFEITNYMRIRHKIRPLIQDREVAKVAYSHSKDMAENNYFSHDSPSKGTLADRLMKADISYQAAGENIAAQYVDAAAVVEGWLNSMGHREALLNRSFTHIGIGVFERHYTQNFLQVESTE